MTDKTVSDLEKEFDKEFPACDCKGNYMVPHFLDSKVNRNWIKNFISSAIKQSNLALLERIETKMKPAIDDWLAAGNTLIEHDLIKSGQEMQENVGYIKGIFHDMKKELEHPND